jgi:ATP-dependent DNA ligase
MTSIITMKYEQAEPVSIDRFADDDDWVMEQKLDGVRILAAVDAAGNVTPYTHGGRVAQPTRRLWTPVAAELAASVRGVTLDGELLEDGTFWVFDVVEAGGGFISIRTPFVKRREFAELLFQSASIAAPVHLVHQFRGAAAKRAAWDAVVDEQVEGAVFKRLTGTYLSHPSRRSPDVVKVKVTHTIDVVVIARNTKGHENATLAVWAPDHPAAPDGLLEVGNCSMGGKPDVAVGEVIEVLYLYVGAGQRLYQPRMLRRRPDKVAAECGLEQLRFTSKAILPAA